MDSSHRPPQSLINSSHSLVPLGGWQTESNGVLEHGRRQSMVESSIRLDMVVMSDGGSRTEIKSTGFLDRLAPTYTVSSWASTRGTALNGTSRSAARGSLSRIADTHSYSTSGGRNNTQQQEQHQLQSRDDDGGSAKQQDSIFKKTQISLIKLPRHFMGDESDEDSDMSFSVIPGGPSNQLDDSGGGAVDGTSAAFDDISISQSQRTLPPHHEQHTQSRNDLFAQIQRSIRTVGRQDGVALLQREQQRRILEAELLRDSSRFLLTSKPTTFFTHTPLSATDAEGVMAKRKLWNIGKKKQGQVQEVLCELVHDDISSSIDHQTRDAYLSRRGKKYDGSVTSAIGPATEVLQSYWRIYGINVQHQVDFVDKVVRRHSIETYKTIVKEINRFSNRSDAYSNVMRLVALRETLLSALISRANNPLLVRDKHELEKKRLEEAAEKETKRAKGNILNFKVAGDEWDRERDRQHQRRQQKSLLEQSRRGRVDDDDTFNENYILDQSAIDKAGDDGGDASSAMCSSALSSIRRSTDTLATLRPRFKAVNLRQKVIDALMPPGFGGGASPGGPHTTSSVSAPKYSISTALGKSKIVTAQIPLESVPGTSQHNNARLSGAAGGVGSLEDRTSVTHATHENMLLEILILISHLRHITVMIVDIITYERMCCREVAVKVSQQIVQVGAGMPQVEEGSKAPEKKAFNVETATLQELRRKRQDDAAAKRKHVAVAGDPLEKLIQSMGDTDDLHLASKVAPSVSAKRIRRKPRRKHQAGDVPLPLMWDGRDYLYKIRNDLSPLDETGLGELLAMAGAQYDEKRGVHVESVAEEGGFYCPRFRFENNPFLLANTTFKRSNDERRGANSRQAATVASSAPDTTSAMIDASLDGRPQSEAGRGAGGKRGSLVVGNPPPPVDSVLVGAYRPHPRTDPVVAANSASISGSTCLFVENAEELAEGRRQKKASEIIRVKRRLIAERKRQIERTQMAEIRGLTSDSTTVIKSGGSPSASRPGTRHALVILDTDNDQGDADARLRDLHTTALSIVDEVNTSSRHVPFKNYFNSKILPDKKERARRVKEAEELAEKDVQRKRLESQGRLANIRDVMGSGTAQTSSASRGRSVAGEPHNNSTRRHHHHQLLLAPISSSSASHASLLLPSDGSPHMPHLSHTIDSSIRPKEDLTEGLFDAYGRHVNRYKYPSHIYAQEEQPFWERTSLIFARSLDPAFMARRGILGSLLAHQIGAEAGRVQRAAMRNQGLGGSAVSTSALGGVGAKQRQDPNYKFRIEGMVKDSMMQRCHTSFPPDVATMEDPERAVEQVVVDPVTKTFTVTWGMQPYTEAELLQRHMVIFNHTIHDARTTDTETTATASEGPSNAFLSAKKKFLRAMTKVRLAINHVKYQRALPSTQRQLRAAQELERWMEVSGAHDFAQSVHHQLTIPLHNEETQRLAKKATAERKDADEQTIDTNDSVHATAGRQVRFLDGNTNRSHHADNDRPQDTALNSAEEEDDSSGEEFSHMPEGYDNPNVLSHPEDTSFRFTPGIANQY